MASQARTGYTASKTATPPIKLQITTPHFRRRPRPCHWDAAVWFASSICSIDLKLFTLRLYYHDDFADEPMRISAMTWQLLYLLACLLPSNTGWVSHIWRYYYDAMHSFILFDDDGKGSLLYAWAAFLSEYIAANTHCCTRVGIAAP